MLYQKLLESISGQLQLAINRQNTTPDDLVLILENHPDLNKDFLSSLPHFLSTQILPKQTYTGQAFSQFPLTILNVGPYNLDIYHWNRTDTSIHNHNFQGAFKVLSGNYVQECYQFTEKSRPLSWLSTGELKLLTSLSLLPGKAVAIVSGEEFIHATHHSEECVTACLRIRETGGDLYSYVRPSLKIEHLPQDANTRKKIDYLNFLNLNFSIHYDEIEKTMESLPGNILFQILFAINVPLWICRPNLRLIARKKLQEKYPKSEWMKEVDRCILEEKLK